MALDKLTYALLSNAPKKVNLFVWDKDIAKYCDLSLNTPINKAGRPRIPTPDEFWIAMLKSLQIQKFASKQDAVIAELNGWVKQQGNLENITSSLVKDRVGQVWKAANLARINRDGK